MDPVQPVRHAQAGLVEPDYLGRGDAVCDLLDKPLEPVRGTLGHGGHGGVGDRGAEQLGQRLGGALLRQELPHIQIEDDRSDPRPILHWRCHTLRRGTARGNPTGAAACDELVLGDPHRHRRQIEHLPPLHPDFRGLCQVSAAAGARARLVPQPLVRLVDQRQRRPRMSRLPARFAAALAAQ